MDATDKNVSISKEIMNVLQRENCTVDQTRDILMYIIKMSGQSATVQFKEIMREGVNTW